MKSILISIRPKWCEMIANGRKTVEVRKTVPKLQTPFKVYIYCTIPQEKADVQFYSIQFGTVIGEFMCDRIEEFTPSEHGVRFKRFLALHDTCLTLAEIRAYLNGKVGYGWHISDLVIYDKPLELSEFTKPYGTIIKAFESRFITRPPQSWCYVEEVHNG